MLGVDRPAGTADPTFNSTIMANNLDTLIDWLRDAYAMERGLEIALRKQADNDTLHASVREKAAVHLEETRQHAESVKTCLESLGTDTSMIKTGMAEAAGTVKGLGTKFAQDERVKDLLAAYASEHFEIACYQALKAAALELGQHEIAAVCGRIISDEERMAAWLGQNLPTVVTSYIRSIPAGTTT